MNIRSVPLSQSSSIQLDLVLTPHDGQVSDHFEQFESMSVLVTLEIFSSRLEPLELHRVVTIRARTSLVYDFLARISRDFYKTILVGKFPSREISEKCVVRRSRITDIQTRSFLPLHHTQCNV